VLLAIAGCENKEATSASVAATNSMSVTEKASNTAVVAYESVKNVITNAIGNTNVTTTNVDNSGINARDRGGVTLLPGDQGNTAADIATTQMIRRTLVGSTNDFSVVAQNVKIITTDGKVTLRGPVNTESEKNGIGAIAKTIAGETNVNNQIEVKPLQ
jgi:osmotically-inducible protein OsmY